MTAWVTVFSRLYPLPGWQFTKSPPAPAPLGSYHRERTDQLRRPLAHGLHKQNGYSKWLHLRLRNPLVQHSLTSKSGLFGKIMYGTHLPPNFGFVPLLRISNMGCRDGYNRTWALRVSGSYLWRAAVRPKSPN